MRCASRAPTSPCSCAARAVPERTSSLDGSGHRACAPRRPSSVSIARASPRSL
jgi:hypothetical protein